MDIGSRKRTAAVGRTWEFRRKAAAVDEAKGGEPVGE